MLINRLLLFYVAYGFFYFRFALTTNSQNMIVPRQLSYFSAMDTVCPKSFR